MSAKHFPNLHVPHQHVWRQCVTLAENLPQHETNMWGREVASEYVHCVKHDVCVICRKTRADVNCLCDKAVGDRCAIRRAWLEQSAETNTVA